MPLAADETVMVAGAVRDRTSPRVTRLAYLRITNLGACLVQHHAMRPDSLVWIPREAILDVEASDQAVTIRVEMEAAPITLVVSQWKSPWSRVLEPVLKFDPAEVAGHLSRQGAGRNMT